MIPRDDALDLARHVLTAVRAQLLHLHEERVAELARARAYTGARGAARPDAVAHLDYLVRPAGEDALADIVDLWVVRQAPPGPEAP